MLGFVYCLFDWQGSRYFFNSQRLLTSSQQHSSRPPRSSHVHLAPARSSYTRRVPLAIMSRAHVSNTTLSLGSTGTPATPMGKKMGEKGRNTWARERAGKVVDTVVPCDTIRRIMFRRTHLQSSERLSCSCDGRSSPRLSGDFFRFEMNLSPFCVFDGQDVKAGTRENECPLFFFYNRVSMDNCCCCSTIPWAL